MGRVCVPRRDWLVQIKRGLEGSRQNSVGAWGGLWTLGPWPGGCSEEYLSPSHVQVPKSQAKRLAKVPSPHLLLLLPLSSCPPLPLAV